MGFPLQCRQGQGVAHASTFLQRAIYRQCAACIGALYGSVYSCNAILVRTLIHDFIATVTDSAIVTRMKRDIFSGSREGSAAHCVLHRCVARCLIDSRTSCLYVYWRGSYSGPSRSNREDDCGQRRLRGWSYAERDSEQLATVPSGSPRLVYGTACQTTMSLLSRWQLSRGA